ncbi:MAG: hypothetical protein EP341_02335 [Sphingomonadales bacterium]|nr:MAG: hypothetical protein EP341_02335 [Sphingomonadales bacterium]
MDRWGKLWLSLIAACAAALLATNASAAIEETAAKQIPATQVEQIAVVQQAQGEGQEHGDVALYRKIVEQMDAGHGYYESAAALHRRGNYPLKPFITVRPPTLAFMTHWLGSGVLYVLAGLLVLANLLVWLNLERDASLPRRLAIAAIIGLGGAAMVGPPQIVMHENWSGLLLSLAMGLYLSRNWWPAFVVMAAALALREFAILLAALIGALALWQRQWMRAGASLALGLGFAIAMFFHWQAVSSVLQPGDLPSPPWQGMRGLSGFVSDTAQLSILQFMPGPIATLAVLAAFFGWAGYAHRGRDRLLPLAWFGGFALVIALFARENNFYWAAVLQPAFLLGLVYLPKAANDLRQTARNRLTKAQ